MAGGAGRQSGTGTAPAGPPGTAAARRGSPEAGPSRPQASLGGGTPAQGRSLGAQGRKTVRKLLAAGLAEFDERGFAAVRVDDVVRRASISHGTFYLYFASKDDLFRALLRDALDDLSVITAEFPQVTGDTAGRNQLRAWVGRFCDVYAAHATVIRILSQAEIVGEEVYGDGLKLMFELARKMTRGMTAAGPELAEHAELTAVACLLMLERVNYLMSVEVRLPREEMIERLSAIIFTAFRSS